MLIIPNTTTTATDTNPGDAVFPSTDSGALTPFVSGYFFVANNSALVSIRKGSEPPGNWTPYALISPTLLPISTDRGGRKVPDFIYGVKAKDAVAGTHAQVFGALYQAGEAGFIPSSQFTGTVAPSGGFNPVVVAEINGITGRVSAAGAILQGTGFSVVHGAAGIYTITYTAPFASVPVVVVTAEGVDRISDIDAGSNLTTGFVMRIVDLAGAGADQVFDFISINPQ